MIYLCYLREELIIKCRNKWKFAIQLHRKDVNLAASPVLYLQLRRADRRMFALGRRGPENYFTSDTGAVFVVCLTTGV